MLKDEFSWLLRWKFLKWLIIGAAGSFVLVYLLTAPLFIRPLYKSEALIFVPLTLFSQQFEQQGIGFGSDAEIDGHIQMLHSTRLLDSLAARFGLAERYGVDIDEPGGNMRLHEIMRTRINIEKTRYHSVSVSVRDHDALKAAALANEIVRLGDVIKEDLLRKNRLAAYHFARGLYEDKLAELDALEDPFQLKDAVVPDRASSLPFRTSGTQSFYEFLLLELSERKSNYEILKKSLETPLPAAYVISPAGVAHRPVWPPRLLLSAAALMVFAVVMIFVEVIRKDVLKD